MSHKNPKWDFATIDAYEGLDSVKGWKKCPVCKEFPRVWIFDNGSYAKCCCGYKYDPAQAQSESIGDVHRRTGGDVSEYSRDNLKIAWNKHVGTITKGGEK